jgi:hypothetical protein
MGGLIVRKPHYSLDEVCSRWEISVSDVAGFVIERELTLSVIVAGVRVEHGSFEMVDDDNWYPIPEGFRNLTGAVGLHYQDAWRVITDGSYEVDSFKAEPNRYLSLPERDGGTNLFAVCRSMLLVRRAELERFEAAQEHAKVSAANETPSLTMTAISAHRGATPKFDWDAFWREVARSILFDGVPESQAALVRRMETWFEHHGGSPDTSTIKKKLSPLWREIAPEAERKHA